MNMKLLCIGIFLICFYQKSVAQNQLSLNGTWEIIYDDKNEGVEKEWHLNKNFDSHPGIKEIPVPSCWEEYERNYEGVAFYRRKFVIPQSWEGKILELNFEASNYITQVWVNEEVVGFHEGGYTPFSFRIDRLVKPGEENTLTVRVISPIILTDKRIDGLGRQEVPMWRGAITGGIWQPVHIKASESIRLTDVFLEPLVKNNSLLVNLEIQNTETHSNNAEVSIKVLSKEGSEELSLVTNQEILPGKNQQKWEFDFPDAVYWSMENPYLYTVNIELKKDSEISDFWTSKFGMREFSIKDNKFTLNGKPMYLKACFFEGLYPVKLAYPDSREMAIKEIILAKEAGFNMIRPWRKPAPQMWLDLCDSLGVLTVGSLVTECMHRPISTPRLPFVVENEVRKTILGNRNRTCIVQWELFNEINRPILSQMLNSMSLLARELDPTRMILDESGGWGEGANIYLPYERVPVKFNDIHHYSGSQVHEREYDGYLATARTKEKLKELGLEGVRGYGKNVVPGMMSYISELGYGSTPDLILNNRLFKEKGNPIVAPTVYHKKMEDELKIAMQKSGFDKIYPDIQKLNLEQQKIHGIANKRMIEATRGNDLIAGYCVHALVGGDWVIGAGLLDLWRNPKTLAYDMTKEANQEQIVSIRILPRNVYAEKGATLKITSISELEEEPATVSVKIKSERGKTLFSNTFKEDFKQGISTLFEEKLNTQKLKGNYRVEVKVTGNSGKVITANTQEFDVFTENQLKTPKTKIALVDPSSSMTSFLTEKNIEFVPFDSKTDKRTPVVVARAQKQNPEYVNEVEKVKEFVNKGGYAIFLEVPGTVIKRLRIGGDLDEVEMDTLPFGAELHSQWDALGGWASKSHIVTDHPVFKGLPTEIIMHGVYENVHPKMSMSKQKGTHIAGEIGYDHYPRLDIMRRHFIGPGETWWAADVLEAEVGEGKMLLSTLDIIRNLGRDPVAEIILFNMLDFASKP